MKRTRRRGQPPRRRSPSHARAWLRENGTNIATLNPPPVKVWGRHDWTKFNA